MVLTDVVATAKQAERAADLANSVARAVTEVIHRIETPDGATLSPVKLTIVREAAAPVRAAGPTLPRNVGPGMVAGLALRVFVAAMRHELDTKIRSEVDVR